MIKAFTFENVNKSRQVTPYSAKVDARVRRDLFRGYGDMIIAGDKNGWLASEATGDPASGFTIKLTDATTFIAGGRLFTIDENVNIAVTQSTKTPNTYIGHITVDIDVNDQNGDFVKIVNAPSFTIGDYENDRFSTVYDIIFVYTTNGWRPFVALHQNGTFLAGAAVNLSTPGVSPDGRSAGRRGQVLSRDDISVQLNGTRVTVYGVLRSSRITGETFDILDVSRSFIQARVGRGSAAIYAAGGVATCNISQGADGYLLRGENVKISGNVNSLDGAKIIAEFDAEFYAV